MNIFTAKSMMKLCSLLFFVLSIFIVSDVSAQISTTTITVNTISSISNVAASPVTVCTGGNVTLTVTGVLGTGAEWTWYTGSCGGTFIGTGENITVNPTTGPSQTTITYYVISVGGACAPSSCQSVNVTVNPTPIITPPANITYCYGTLTNSVPVTITPSGAQFDITGGTSIGLANTPAATDIPTFIATNATNAPLTATITLTPSGGCPGSPVTFNITVLPEITMTNPADLTACNGATVPGTTFSGGPVGTIYNWVNDNISTGLEASGTGNIAAFPGDNDDCINNISVIDVTPQLTVNSVTCPGTAQQMTITIHPTPNGSIDGGTICEGQNAILTFTSSCDTGPFTLGVAAGGLTPVVSYPGVASGASFDVTPAPTATTVYNLMTITDANGCSNP